jgi:hypothetical protein
MSEKRGLSCFNIIEELNRNADPLSGSDQIVEGCRPIFVIGLPRSGTTILEQALLDVFKFGYIDNISTKFWNIPEYGIALSSELYPFANRQQKSFQSHSGFTSDIFGPHEFGYFWKRFFDYQHGYHEIETIINQNQKDALRTEITKLINLFNCSFVLKNPVAVTLNAKLLSEILPEALFILIERERHEIAESLLRTRLNTRGDINQWFSGIPKECVNLSKYDSPFEQVAQQVIAYEENIRVFQAAIKDSSRLFSIQYQTFCNNPIDTFRRIKTFFHDNNVEHHFSLETFDPGQVTMPSKNFTEWAKHIEEAFQKIAHE